MGAAISIVFYSLLGYTFLGAFQYRISMPFYIMGTYLKFVQIPFIWINLNLFHISPLVYGMLFALFFAVAYSIVKNVFLIKK